MQIKQTLFFGSAVRKWRGSKLPCMVSPSPKMASDLLTEEKGLKANKDRKCYYHIYLSGSSNTPHE